MLLRKLLYCAMLLMLGFAIGCGGKEETPAPAAPAPKAAPSANAFDASKATATVSGKILFEGAAPSLATLQMGADPFCKSAHSSPVTEQTVQVNADGSLKDVVVYVKSGADKWTYQTPAEPVVLDQVGCMYKPHVVALMINQQLKILNSDPTLHNIHALATKNQEFNQGMPTKGMELTKSFAQAEVIPVKCDVHRWMQAYWVVLDNPFHSVTGEDGMYTIKLPAGTYTIEAWHEKYGAMTQEITVADNEAKDAPFTFKAS